MTAHRKRIALTVDTGQITGTLTNSTFFFNFTNSELVGQDSADFRFVASDGTTEIAHQIKYWNDVTGEISGWVILASGQVGSVVYLLHEPAATISPRSTTDSQTWRSTHIGVYAMNEASGSLVNYAPAAGYPSSAAAQGTPVYGGTDQVGNSGGSILLDGIEDAFNTGIDTEIAGSTHTAIYAEGFFRKNGTGDARLICSGTSGAVGDHQFSIGIADDTVRCRFGTDSQASVSRDFGTITKNADQHVGFYYDAEQGGIGAGVCYINGAYVDDEPRSGTYIPPLTSPLMIGTLAPTVDRFFEGNISFVRVMLESPPSAEIAAFHQSMENPGTFWSVGASVPNPEYVSPWYQEINFANPEETISTNVWKDIPGSSITITPDSTDDVWIVLAMGQIGHSGPNASSFHTPALGALWRLLKNDVDVKGLTGLQTTDTAGTPIYTVFMHPICFMDYVTGTTSPQTYKLQQQHQNGTSDTAYFRDGRIVAFRLPDPTNADFQVWENNTQDVPWTSLDQILIGGSFTPASAGDYLMLASICHTEGASGNTSRTWSTMNGQIRPDELVDLRYNNGRNVYLTQAHFRRESLGKGAGEIALRGHSSTLNPGVGPPEESVYQYAKMFVFRLDVFEGYDQSEALVAGTTVSSSFLKRTTLTVPAPPTTPRDQLNLWNQRDRGGSAVARATFRRDAIELLKADHLHSFDQYMRVPLWAETVDLSAGSYDIDVGGSSGVGTVEFDESRVAYLRFPEAVAGGGGGGTPLVANLADSVAVSDSIEVVVAYARSFEDTVAPVDLIDYAATLNIDLSDTVAVTDALAKDVTKSLGDSVDPTDSLAVASGVEFTFEDTVDPTDALAFASGIEINLADAVGVTDAIDYSAAYVREFEDTVDPVDAITIDQSGAGDVSLGDSIGVSDSIDVAATYVREFEDTIDVTDSLDYGATFERIFEEPIALADAAVAALGVEFDFEDTVDVTDSIEVTNAVPYTFASEDTVAVADSIEVVVDHARNFEESIPVVDSYDYAATYVRTFEESIPVTETDLIFFEADLQQPVYLRAESSAISLVGDPAAISLKLEAKE